jgi:hypothetical protein
MIAKFYIGANNATGRVEKRKIYKTLKQGGIKGFFLKDDGRGSDGGKMEDAVKLEIAGMSVKDADKLAREFKRVLNQESIGVVISREKMRFVS